MSSKLVGLSKGQVRTLGDTGTVAHDGSIIIGNADTDDIEVNAEFTSSLVPNATATYSLGSASKSWSQVFTGALFSMGGMSNIGSNGNGVSLVFPATPGANQIYAFQDVSSYDYPNNTVTVAIEGSLPSYLSFGKNGSLTAPETGFELTTINGAQNGAGWRMPTYGIVTHISIQCACTSVGSGDQIEVILTKNGSEQQNYKITLSPSATGDLGGSVAFWDGQYGPLQLSPNDTIGMVYKSSVSSGTLTTTDHACLIRILN